MNRITESILEKYNKEHDLHGVEYTTSHGMSIQYVNAGDTYKETLILLDGTVFLLGSVGDLIESIDILFSQIKFETDIPFDSDNNPNEYISPHAYFDEQMGLLLLFEIEESTLDVDTYYQFYFDPYEGKETSLDLMKFDRDWQLKTSRTKFDNSVVLQRIYTLTEMYNNAAKYRNDLYTLEAKEFIDYV